MTNTEILNKLGLYGAASSISIGGSALAGVLGQAVLPTAIAAAVGTAGTVAAACATGSAIMILPQILLSEGLNAVFPKDSYPLLNPLLSFGLQAGLIYATALYLVPYVFLVVSAALRNLDSSIEEASRVSGAPPIRTLTRITLPAIRPSVVAGFILAIIAGIGLFSVPIVLGTAARVEVVSVFIYRLLDQFPPKLASGLMLSAAMVALVQMLLVIQRWVSPIDRGAMSGGRSGRSGRIRLGVWKRPAQIMIALYLMATSILPVAGLLVVS
ncbi:MAG: ABC transporter permease subunit, partial [Methylocystaceae bacterium]|nr:ABC transporter permease subunit [Methylocystaceae bacterium]